MQADAADGLERFRQALRTAGLAATRQRLELARTVFATNQHFSVEDLRALVGRRGVRVGRVTVYRTLKTLLDAGLVEERGFYRDRMLYEHTVGAVHHDHMVCVACGRILEFRSPVIEREQDRVARRHGFQVVSHSHTLFGRCRACRER